MSWLIWLSTLSLSGSESILKKLWKMEIHKKFCKPFNPFLAGDASSLVGSGLEPNHLTLLFLNKFFLSSFRKKPAEDSKSKNNPACKRVKSF